MSGAEDLISVMLGQTWIAHFHTEWTKGLSRADFALWHPRARAALVKAVSIRAGAPNPAPTPPSFDLNSQTAETNETTRE
ncbi:protein of unknown function (plasmid) [Methylocella tundrae]|uniref:Uncharacterized protein n=1 Tax=Methylocella tundrae TaxID=227605 RepID=A0A4U8Z7F0_METTU|nr:hypothetical protein [Methylocella tundrae]VFU17479.1 protein of unknown function [Methylocella tundrae]